MNHQHFSEKEIQDIALGAGDLPATGCPHCQAALLNYRKLFSGLKNQDSPAFDFDLSALVLSQIPKPKPLRQTIPLPGIALVGLFVFAAGYYLIKSKLPMFTSLFLALLLDIFLFLLLDLLVRYKHAIKNVEICNQMPHGLSNSL